MKGIFSEKDGRVRILCLIATVLTVALGAFNGVLNVLFFEERKYMYQQGSEGAWTVYYVLCTLAVLLFAVVYIINKRSQSELITGAILNVNERLPFAVLRFIAGATFLAGVGMRFYFFFNEKGGALPEIVVILMLVCFLCLAFYLFPQISVLEKRFGIGGEVSFCGMLGAVAFIVDTLAVYADMSIPIASEYRLFTAVCAVLFLLALVLELRMKVAEPNSYGYLAMLSIATVVAGSTSIGRIVSVIAGKAVFGTELARTVCGVAITVYFISRLLSVVFAPVYLADCGGMTFIEVPPMEDDMIENCGGIPMPEPIPEIVVGETEVAENSSEDAE